MNTRCVAPDEWRPRHIMIWACSSSGPFVCNIIASTATTSNNDRWPSVPSKLDGSEMPLSMRQPLMKSLTDFWESIVIRQGRATRSTGVFPKISLPPARHPLIMRFCALDGEVDTILLPNLAINRTVWLAKTDNNPPRNKSLVIAVWYRRQR